MNTEAKNQPTIVHFQYANVGERYPVLCGAPGHEGWHTEIDANVTCYECLGIRMGAEDPNPQYLFPSERGSWLEDVSPVYLPVVRIAYADGFKARYEKRQAPNPHKPEYPHVVRAWDLGFRGLPLTRKWGV